MKKMTLVLLGAILCCALTMGVTAADDIVVLIDGEYIQFDVPPQIINNRTMVPMRAIFEAFGATVEWDAQTRTVTADTGWRTITMTIGEKYYYIDGAATSLDVPAQIIDNRTLVPVRAISEALDCEVGWDSKDRIVSIIEDWTNYQMLYADGGRQRAFHVSDVPGQLTVGWMDYWTYNGISFDASVLLMTETEKQIASSVYWISERSVQYEEAEKCFILLFSLQDYNENYLKAPAVVDVRIENDNGEIVYDGMEFVYTENYSTWSNRFGKSWLAASVKIPVDWITPGTTEYGTIYFTVHNEEYFSFDEYALTLSGDLPTIDLAEGCVLHLPECPISISDEDYRDYLLTVVTDVTYSFEESYGDVELYLYFTGERTDFEPDGYVSKYCSIGWKLYDKDGYVIDSGTATTPALEPGDRFRNVEEHIYNLTPGEYWLEILDVVG